MPLKTKITYFLMLILAGILIYMVYLTKADDTEISVVGVRGMVQEIKIQDVNTGTGTIFVKGAMYKDTAYDAAYVTINDLTEIIRPGNEELRYKISDLKEDDFIDVYFEGPVAESYPVQGHAEKIIINTITTPTDIETDGK